ncbi:hypothetical protein HHX47_DHR4000716 [Lentinula edodes]|nr:hypothetical protein HHX47_DHR4000716 [Lentinula edodes]
MFAFVRNSIATSSSAWLPLLYDTVVLGLTLGATIPSVRDARGSTTVYVMRRLLQDGLIYFGAYQSNTDNHSGEAWRPYSLSLPAPLVNPPSIHTPTSGKGRDQDYGAPVDDIEFERRSLAFSSHPYAMTRPLYD